jgi:D-alanyl-D-alanine carboxypeptidase/D-alanyl-D-alanine-endopeptidase (penicillin-binding protein 4)
MAAVAIAWSAGAAAPPQAVGATGDVPTVTALNVAEPINPDAPIPPAANLSQAMAGLTAETAGNALGVSVVDALTGQELLNSGAAGSHVPASTLKVLTAIAAIERLGVNHTLATTVQAQRTGPTTAQLTLVAGGDAMLAPGKGLPAAVNGRAGLGDLAQIAATELRRQGVTQVTLALDDTLFSGINIRPDWDWWPTAPFVGPISPLAINTGHDGPGFDATTYNGDPAMAAAARFADQFNHFGGDTALTTPPVATVGAVTRAKAPAGTDEIARVESAPVGQLVGYQLANSDNTLAEVLGRLTALAAGQPATFEGAGQAIIQTVAGLGVDTPGLVLMDASGLSHASKIAPATLTQLLALAAGPDRPDLAVIARGLPVGGLEGTLLKRFTTQPAAGNVRAKTGTLTGVNSLAGYVQTAEGRELAFAILADDSAGIDAEQVRATIDAAVTELAKA